MKRKDWFKRIEDNKSDLLTLISCYHPAVRHKSDLKVTANNAQIACDNVCRAYKYKRVDPCADFEKAIEMKDDLEISNILNETWFGVPESTSCWSITGFPVAVEIMEDTLED